MTKNDLDKELAELGDGFGMETGGWEYPTIGYNTTDGVFYVGDDEAKELEMVVLAVRRCKEVEDANEVIWRYGPYVKKVNMKQGKMKQRLQAVVVINDKLHIFGARSWTARALFDNDADGQYHDRNYQAGLWGELKKFIKKVKAERGVDTSPYCWRIKLATGAAFQNPMDKKRKITPITYEGPPFTFVGKVKAAEYKSLLESEDLKGWADEWHTAIGDMAQSDGGDTSEPGAIGTQEDSLDDIPGFDL
jgi:hypothetical protein